MKILHFELRVRTPRKNKAVMGSWGKCSVFPPTSFGPSLLLGFLGVGRLNVPG